MSSLFIDTNIPMYAAGTPHPLREHAQRVIRWVVEGRVDGVTDAEVFQEILYRYFAIGERTKGLQIFDSFYRIMAGRILPVSGEDVRQARDLADHYPRLSPRDLVHLSVMLGSQLEEIVSADQDFDDVQEVKRIALEAFPLDPGV